MLDSSVSIVWPSQSLHVFDLQARLGLARLLGEKVDGMYRRELERHSLLDDRIAKKGSGIGIARNEVMAYSTVWIWLSSITSSLFLFVPHLDHWFEIVVQPTRAVELVQLFAKDLLDARIPFVDKDGLHASHSSFIV